MKTVVLTRQSEDNVSLKKLLNKKEFSEKIQVQEFPCLRVVSHAPLQEQIDVLAKLFSFESPESSSQKKKLSEPLASLAVPSQKIIFFLASQKAWMSFFSWLQEQLPSEHPHFFIKKFLTDSLLSAVFVAVGKKTAEAIQKDGFSVALTENYAQTLSEKIIKEFSTQDYVIIKPRGNLSRTTGEDFLQEQGVKIYSLTVYTNEEVFPPSLDFPLHGVVFYSPSAVRRFFQNNPPKNFKEKTIFFSIGETTSHELERLGLPSFSPSEMTDKAMASLIKEKLF